MSRWTPLTLQTIPGVDDALAATGQAADFLGGALAMLSQLISTLSEMVRFLSDALHAAIAGLIELIRTLARTIEQLLSSSISVYVDGGPLFTGAPPDGVAGWLERWGRSFGDSGDRFRPQFPPGERVSAVLILVGAGNPPDFLGLLQQIGRLFGVPAWDLARHGGFPGDDLSGTVERSLPTPPDWATAPLGEVLVPFAGLSESLYRLAGVIAVAEPIADLLSGLAETIGEKGRALQGMARELQQIVMDLETLTQVSGLHVLRVEAVGVDHLIDQALTALPLPPLPDDAFVAGVCLLGGTANFGAVGELLGGGG